MCGRDLAGVAERWGSGMGAEGGGVGVGKAGRGKEVGGRAVEEEGSEDEGAEGAEGDGDGSVIACSRWGSDGGRWTAIVKAVGGPPGSGSDGDG